jgi:hypothetical protein
MNDEGFRKSMADQGNTVKYLDPEQYLKFWDAVDAKYKPLIDIAKAEK